MNFRNPTQGITFDGESTWANRGSGSRNGAIKYITDVGDSGCYMRWNGTYWRVTAAIDVHFDTTTVTGNTTGNDQILKQTLLPVGLLRAGRYFGVWGSFGKNGATDAATANRIRLGSAGTPSDATILMPLAFVSGSRSLAYEGVLSLNSATQAGLISHQTLLVGGSTSSLSNLATSTAYQGTITIPDVDATALYVSQCIDLAGTTDAPQGFVLGVKLYP